MIGDKIINALASQSAESEEQILTNNGGRLWKINLKTNSYLLKYQFRTHIAKIRVHNKLLYKYILAFNTEYTIGRQNTCCNKTCLINKS